MRHCAICGKGSIMAGTRRLLRGHYNPTNWTRKYPNLQKHRTETGKRILACAQCLRGMHKPKRNFSKPAPSPNPAEPAKV